MATGTMKRAAAAAEDVLRIVVGVTLAGIVLLFIAKKQS